MPILTDMATWTDRLGHSQLRTFAGENGTFWLEQNSAKDSRWAKLAREGHKIAWEFQNPGGAYTGRVLVDGEIYNAAEASRRFLKSE